jgi:hypothetical protein
MPCRSCSPRHEYVRPQGRRPCPSHSSLPPPPSPPPVFHKPTVCPSSISRCPFVRCACADPPHRHLRLIRAAVLHFVLQPSARGSGLRRRGGAGPIDFVRHVWGPALVALALVFVRGATLGVEVGWAAAARRALTAVAFLVAVGGPSLCAVLCPPHPFLPPPVRQHHGGHAHHSEGVGCEAHQGHEPYCHPNGYVWPGLRVARCAISFGDACAFVGGA